MAPEIAVGDGRTYLASLLQREILVCLEDSRQRVKGRLYCVDGLWNLVLSDALEEVWCASTSCWQERRFSLVVVPARCVRRVYVLDVSRGAEESEKT